MVGRLVGMVLLASVAGCAQQPVTADGLHYAPRGTWDADAGRWSDDGPAPAPSPAPALSFQDKLAILQANQASIQATQAMMPRPYMLPFYPIQTAQPRSFNCSPNFLGGLRCQ